MLVRTVLCLLVLFPLSSFLPSAGSSLSPSASSSPSAVGTTKEAPASYVQVGEELRYRVSYWFIGLGEIRVRVAERYQKNGEALYRAEVFIDSYSGNPFVDLHQYYETEFDTTLTSRYFHGRWNDGDTTRYVKYNFQYDEGRVIIEKGVYNPHIIQGYDTTEINRRFQDGLSLFYFARAFVKSGEKMLIPTFINEEKKRTFFNFTNKFTDEEINSVSYPIDVVEFNGEADWVGVFGLTGSFRGWFSNDEARIPIVARMKVIIGSVKITLQSWKRESWKPPEYKDREKRREKREKGT